MTVSQIVRQPAAPAGLQRGIPVLHLACALTEDQVSGLAATVLARLAKLRQTVGTVVLDLGSGLALDGRGRAELCTLRALLRQRGTGLRLVIGSRKDREALAAAADHRIAPDVVHDCPRAAILAAYAQAPGPGLVDAGMRATLAAPPVAL